MLWDTTLDIGVEPMNAEHRDILDCMNQIFDAHAKSVKGPSINMLVDRLGDICVTHFRDEEAFMRSIGFPGLQTHQLLHKKLLARYGELAAQIKSDGGVANNDFFQFLKFWLSSHIQGIDVKYAEHSRNARPAA